MLERIRRRAFVPGKGVWIDSQRYLRVTVLEVVKVQRPQHAGVVDFLKSLIEILAASDDLRIQSNQEETLYRDLMRESSKLHWLDYWLDFPTKQPPCAKVLENIPDSWHLSTPPVENSECLIIVWGLKVEQVTHDISVMEMLHFLVTPTCGSGDQFYGLIFGCRGCICRSDFGDACGSAIQTRPLHSLSSTDDFGLFCLLRHFRRSIWVSRILVYLSTKTQQDRIEQTAWRSRQIDSCRHVSSSSCHHTHLGYHCSLFVSSTEQVLRDAGSY